MVTRAEPDQLGEAIVSTHGHPDLAASLGGVLNRKNKGVRRAAITGLIVVGFVAPAVAQPINVIPYESIGPHIVDFENVVSDPPLLGVHFDEILDVVIANGDTRVVSFAERFVGQTLSFNGDFDVLSGMPTEPLTLQPGAADRNIAVSTFAGSNVLLPYGRAGFPEIFGAGEGAFAVLFPAPVSEFGFQVFGSNREDPAFVQFFRGDGTLIGAIRVIVPGGIGPHSFGFMREDGINDIAGVSIHNFDLGGLAYDNLVFDESANTVLLAGMGEGPDDPGTETAPVNEDDMATARLPLGSTFFIQLAEVEEETGMPVPIESVFTLEAASVTPVIAGPTLFPDSVVIEYDRAAASQIKFFTAVHLGTVRLIITPTDSSIPPVSVEVTVTEPLALGNSSNEYDERLMDLGHRRGVPPHLLKGQIRQESNFDPKAYRYEPLTVDLGYVSRGQTIRTQEPYSLYRLETDDGLAEGTGIVADDISPRSIYRIRREGMLRPISNEDQLVSAREIFEENDARHNWLRSASPTLQARVVENPTLLDFTGQTPVAGSYGLLQILYSTAIAPMNWAGVGEDGRRNPSLLFDTTENLEMGGGSLELGSDYLAFVFPLANPLVFVTDPQLSNPMTFQIAFERAFNLYRGSKNFENDPYGPSVLSFSQQFEPIPSTSIFP
jgi:hypothetical protein